MLLSFRTLKLTKSLFITDFYAILPASEWNVCSFYGTLKIGQIFRKRGVGNGKGNIPDFRAESQDAY